VVAFGGGDPCGGCRASVSGEETARGGAEAEECSREGKEF